MASENSSFQGPKHFEGDGEAEAVCERSDSPLYSRSKEEKSKPGQLDFSMISSGSSSFEVLSMSTTESEETSSSAFGLDEQNPQALDRDDFEGENLGKLKKNQNVIDDGRQQQLGNSLSESSRRISGTEPENEEMSQIRIESIDESLVVLGQGDMCISLLSEQSTNVNEEGDNRHDLPGSKTKSDKNDNSTADITEEKDESLGESLVVHGKGDFENSLSSEVHPQSITDKMLDSMNEVLHGEDRLVDNVSKTAEFSQSKSLGEAEIIREEPVVKPDSDEKISCKKKDKKIDVSISTEPRQTKLTLDSSQTSQHLYKDEEKQEINVDPDKYTSGNTEHDVSPMFKKTEKSDSPEAGPTLPISSDLDPGLDNVGSLSWARSDSLVIQALPHEQPTTSEAIASYYSSSDIHNDTTNSGFNKQGSMDEYSKNGSLSESLVVIQRDEVEITLSEGISAADRFSANQENYSQQTEERLNSKSGLESSTYHITGDKTQIGLTNKVIENIVESMSSFQTQKFSVQAAGGYRHIESSEEFSKDASNSERNDSLEGSCVSTDSFAILSDSMSESYLASEAEWNQLQSELTFTGRDIPVIEHFQGNKEDPDGKDASFVLDKKERADKTETKTSQLNIQREKFTVKTEDIERYQENPDTLEKNIQIENQPKVNSSFIDDGSMERTTKSETMIENEDPDFSRFEPNREVHEERWKDLPYPSLSSGSSVSMASFVILDENGRSESLRSSNSDENRKQTDEYLSGKLAANPDIVDQSTMYNVDKGGVLTDDQINIGEPRMKMNKNDSLNLDSSSLQADRYRDAREDHREEIDVIISTSANEDTDEKVTSNTEGTEVLQPFHKNGKNFSKKDSANSKEEDILEYAQKFDEEPQSQKENEGKEQGTQCKNEDGIVAHSQSSNIEEDKMESQPMDVNFPSLSDFSLLEEPSQDTVIGSKTRKATADEHMGVYEQHEGHIEVKLSKSLQENLRDPKAANEQERINLQWIDTNPKESFTVPVKFDHDTNSGVQNTTSSETNKLDHDTDSVGFQDTASSEIDKENFDQHEEESDYTNRKFSKEGPVESGEIPSIDTSNDRIQLNLPSDQELDKQTCDHEEEDDTTLTLEKTAQCLLHEDGVGQKDLTSGKQSEETGTPVEWYHEPVTIYVLREWSEFEDHKSKVRKDQQTITKSWIDVEKIRFLFNSFHLSVLLKTKLSNATSVIFNDLKTYLYISHEGSPFSSAEDYRSWWLETIHAIFETVDEISAYLCKLDNATKESTMEAVNRLTYANIKVKSTKIPETFLVLGTTNIGSTLHMIQNQDDHHHLVCISCMREVKVVQISRQWTRWCRHLMQTKWKCEETGVLGILANEDNDYTYLIIDICHKAEIQKDQLYIEQVLQTSFEQKTFWLDEGECELLSSIEVKHYIDNRKLMDMAYHWIVRKDRNAYKLLVLADNQEIAKEVGTLIKSSVKCLDIKTPGTEHHEKFKVLKKQFGDKLFWLEDNTTEMIKVYITEDILDHVDETIKLLGGKKLASVKEKTATANIHVAEYDRIQFLHKFVKDDIIQMRKDFQVTVLFQDVSHDQNVIKISGKEERVLAACSEIQKMVDDIHSFQHPNVELHIPQNQIDKVRDLTLVNRCVIATHTADSEEMDDEQLSFDNFPNKMTAVPSKWWTCGPAQLGFITGPVSSVAASTLVNLLPNHLQSSDAKQKTIFVPPPDEGKSKDYLLSSIQSVFNRLSLNGERAVVVDLCHCYGWPFQKFLKVVLYALQELWNSPTSGCGAMDITLAVPTDEEFRLACKTIELSGLPRRKSQDPVKLLVIKGDITKEQTDVIVNTASKELDLSNGAVSKALSGRAGPKLQQECKNKYPKGIKYGELAVTEGYQLHCKKVFHGAFDTWPAKHSRVERKETVGKFVTKCLEKANELGMCSISFPAIGTGNLGYPSSLVAKEMLQRIRHFLTDSKATCLRKVNIVIYPSNARVFKDFTEENSFAGIGSSVDSQLESQPVKIRKPQTTSQCKVCFKVTCWAGDQMILVSKIDTILKDLSCLGPDDGNNYSRDLESEMSQDKSFRHDEVTKDMITALKESKSETGVVHYSNMVTSNARCCVVIQSQKSRTDVWNWLEHDIGIRPVGIAWPYKNNVTEALVTCTSITDAEKVLVQQRADFQASRLGQQVLFNVCASVDPQFVLNKEEIEKNSGVTLNVDSSGICQLVGNLPQVEAANEYITWNLQDNTRSSGNASECCVDGITTDVYNAFLFFFCNNPSYNRYKDILRSVRYSEVDRTICFKGSKEFCMDFKNELSQMKTNISCDQIDVEGRHFKPEHVKEILRHFLDSQNDVHISTPHEDTLKVINLIGLDRNKVQAMKYQVLESIGMTSSRRSRRFDCGLFSLSRKQDPPPVLPPPANAKRYYLGNNMTVLAYEGNILGLKVDGIVNAANEWLEHGGGVARAISDAANIQSESNEYVRRNGKVPVGTSCHTSSGDLKHYKYIIHSVGPRWEPKKQDLCENLLQEAVLSCILEADDLQLESVAIPAISAGIFSMPPELCVKQYFLGVKMAWSRLQKRAQCFLKEIHFVDKNANILHAIQTQFDSHMQGFHLDPLGLVNHQQTQSKWQNRGLQIPSSSSFNSRTTDYGTQGARPKALYPYQEFNNIHGIDQTTFHLTSLVRVHVYTCDILATRVDAVVCGQDKALKSKSRIASQVLEGELSGKDFKREISEIKRKKKVKIKSGDVFCVPVIGFDARFLVMVVCPTVIAALPLSKFKGDIKKCAENIFQKTSEMNLHSIALPVFGSGNDVSKAGDIAKVIMEAILKFAQNAHSANCLRDIHFVNHDSKVTQIIVKIFEDHVTTENARIKQNLPRVYPGTAHRQEMPSAYELEPKISVDHYLNEWQSCLNDNYLSGKKLYSDDRYPSELHRPSLGDSNHSRQTTDQPELRANSNRQYQAELSLTKEKSRVYEDCVICMETVTSDNVKTLSKCNHSFHPECIDEQFKHKPVCPTCGAIHGIITGNQPRNGRINIELREGPLPGFVRDRQHFYIKYSFPDGIQESDHPNPGVPYKGTRRGAYLPCNDEGRAVLSMLKIAFKRRLTFTIGHSRTTGEENVVTWNDIHHKTSINGGQQQFGYPDPEYLARVTEELAAKGVTKADIE